MSSPVSPRSGPRWPAAAHADRGRSCGGPCASAAWRRSPSTALGATARTSPSPMPVWWSSATVGRGTTLTGTATRRGPPPPRLGAAALHRVRDHTRRRGLRSQGRTGGRTRLATVATEQPEIDHPRPDGRGGSASRTGFGAPSGRSRRARRRRRPTSSRTRAIAARTPAWVAEPRPRAAGGDPGARWGRPGHRSGRQRQDDGPRRARARACRARRPAEPDPLLHVQCGRGRELQTRLDQAGVEGVEGVNVPRGRAQAS